MRHFSLFSAAIMATMLLFAGCDPVEEPAPVLTPTTEGTIQIPAAGGSGKITYTLENAAKDGNIEATSTADWIGGWDYSVQGTVTLDVAENVEQASRDAEITVIYNYGDDVEETRYNNLTPETKFYTFSVGMDMQMNYTTEFYWGPEFTTLEAEDTGLTFEIEVEPQKTTANLKVIPSDKSAKYLATTLDESEAV